MVTKRKPTKRKPGSEGSASASSAQSAPLAGGASAAGGSVPSGSGNEHAKRSAATPSPKRSAAKGKPTAKKAGQNPQVGKKRASVKPAGGSAAASRGHGGFAPAATDDGGFAESIASGLSAPVGSSPAQETPDRFGAPARSSAAASRSGAASSRDGVSNARPAVRKKKSLAGKIVLAVVLVVVLACVGFAAFLAWDRWGAFDDAADMQGVWQANGSDSVVVIDGEKIQLTDDVSYSYEIDSFAKTITFHLGNMEGQGRYRFSPDRSQLVITDGPNYSWLSTLLDDLPWRVQALQDELAGAEEVGKVTPSGEEDGLTILDKG